MPNIRIKDIPTTASATSSTDFIGIDGSANGTRKLNAYSPTFGGNLTVTGTSALGDATGGVFYQASLNSNNQGTGVRLLNNNAGSRNWYIGSQNNVGNAVEITPSTANNGTTFSTPVWQISSAGNVTQTGNLTVSGGTITGGTSGMSLASGGTNQNITLTPSGTGAVAITGISNGSNALTASTGTVNLALNLSSGSTGAAFGTTSAHAVSFITSNVVRGVFTNTGNFLIGGTIDGGQKLQVNGDSGFLGHLEIPADKHIYMKQGNPLRWSSDGLSTGTVRADIYADSGGILYFRTNGTTAALNIDASQNATFAGKVRGTYLGINVAPSSGSLRAYIVESAAEGTPTLTGGEVMILQRNAIAAQSCEMALISGSTSTSTLAFGDKDSANIGRVSYDHSANSLSIITNSATATTFDSSGNIIQKVNGTAPTLGTNSTMTFELTSNTSLTIKVRGTDGTTRSVALTLA